MHLGACGGSPVAFFCRKWGRASLILGLLLAGLLLLPACGREKAEPVPQTLPVPVLAAPVVQKPMPVLLKAVGTVEASASVAVKSRVGGELQQVHFVEGQEVQKGDLLFTIDPRPYEAALKEARAKLARDRALLKKAKEDAERYGRLIKEELISREQYDQVVATAEALAATVLADEAAVEHARLQLGYCHIYSPVSGRTGSLLVHRGNLIKAEDEKNPLVIIHQIQPIYVSFALPERYFLEVKQAMLTRPLPLTAVIGRDEKLRERGILTFLDNQVDAATGTVRLKGTFDNRDKRLWPGQFVEVTLELAARPEAVVVPAPAVQSGQGEEYVFVIRPDNTVEYRPVKVERIQDGEAVIQAGLRPGEQVVTEGHLRLLPGARVEIKGGGPGRDKPS